MTLDPTNPVQTFASWFRNATPYIQAHRGATFVVLLRQETLGQANLVNLVHDLALLQVLGVRLVLLADPASADQLVQLQALFQAGLPNTPLHGTHIPLTTLTLDTRVDVAPVRAALDQGHLVLATSPESESTSAATAANLALSLDAEKLLLFNDVGMLRDTQGTPSSMLTPEDLRLYLSGNADATDFAASERAMLSAAADCVAAGVPRAHVVSHTEDGALLGELFTADGHGTQISEEQQTPIRQATLDDLAGIIEIIRPLEAKGALVHRSDTELAAQIQSFLVAELDGFVIGCCLVAPIPDAPAAELGCVAVAASYRQSHNRQRTSIGSRLLANAEASARNLGKTQLFALTTGPVTWFEEQGFERATLADLPPEKQSRYNHKRQSKVLRKSL